MSIKSVTMQEAEGHLDELLALVVQGEEVIITKDDQPCAKLVAVPLIPKTPRGRRAFPPGRARRKPVASSVSSNALIDLLPSPVKRRCYASTEAE